MKRHGQQIQRYWMKASYQSSSWKNAVQIAKPHKLDILQADSIWERLTGSWYPSSTLGKLSKSLSKLFQYQPFPELWAMQCHLAFVKEVKWKMQFALWCVSRKIHSQYCSSWWSRELTGRQALVQDTSLQHFEKEAMVSGCLVTDQSQLQPR